MEKEIDEILDVQKTLLDEAEILLKSFNLDEFLKKFDEFLKLCEKILELKKGEKNGK